MIKDLHASDHHFVACGGVMEAKTDVGGGGDREIWLGGTHSTDDLLVDVDDSLFYGGDFPPLPDFPCMSSSSSTSSTPAPAKPIGGPHSSSTSSASSSSAASWAVLKSDTEEDRGNTNPTVDAGSTQAALSSTASMELSQPHDQDRDRCMDVMESYDYVDRLIESSNDFFDPCSLFQQDYPPEDFQVPDLKLHQNQDQDQFRENFGSAPFLGTSYQNQGQENDQFMMIPTHDDKNNPAELTQLGGGGDSDDLGSVFLEWLKNNKETVSAEDLRKVKIKKATIECAAKRLGGGRDAMKHLLKLILEWVQSHHLQKRRLQEAAGSSDPTAPASNITYQEPQFQNPNPNNNLVPQEPNGFSWNFPEPTYDPAAGQPMYVGDPYGSGVAPPYTAVGMGQDYNHMLDSAQTWPVSQFALQGQTNYGSFADRNNLNSGHLLTGFGNQYNNQYQYFQGNGDNKLARLGSSATKEARKKRMARQRRLFTHHRSHNHHQSNFQQNPSADPVHARAGGENCSSNPGSWMYHWPSSEPGPPVDGQKASGLKPNSGNDRRQGWKPEKNLRFLLQKVLKQSDVGNLGRIVLPKKEAETHLPELEARDGIAISMEDIGTSRVWNMRYRFWPNNKSRMYLLENTGDFVRTNGLQEGDFIVIYSDVKYGKYLIRGVKVRQQQGPKSETKRSGKAPRNQQSASPAGNDSLSSPITQATK